MALDEATEVALDLMGGVVEALTHPELFEKLAGLVRQMLGSESLTRWVGSRLTVGEIVDLAVDVAINEGESDRTENEGFKSEPGKRAVVRMYLRGFEPEDIAIITAQPVERVAQTLTNRAERGANPHERTIVRQYLNGIGALEIARTVGVGRETVYNTLERAGIKVPSRKLTPARVKEEVIRLRNEGASYEQIRAATGVDTTTLKNTLRAAAKKGLLTSYGAERVA